MYQILTNYDELFSDFKERAELLKTVTRFKIYKPMFYRSDLLTHSKHVFWLLQTLLPIIYKHFGDSFDGVKAQLMAAVHDDPEVIMGDVEAGIKRKMTKEQLKELDDIELKAIDTLAARSPLKILGYSYADLMREAVGLETLESKIGKFADRFDAHGETLHELYAGNRSFITPVVNEWGEIDLPAPFYVRFLNNFKNQFPELAPLYKSNHPMLTPPLAPNYEQIVSSSAPHTEESLNKNTEYVHYNFWKKTILSNADERERLKMLMRSEI